MRYLTLTLVIICILAQLENRDLFTLPEHERLIAVCISGQPGRMLPELMLSGLVNANINILFHVYFNLQHSSTVFTNKHAVNEASLSKYHNMSTDAIKQSLQQLFRTVNSKVMEVQFHAPHSADYWKEVLHINTTLDRITQFKGPYSHVILNMYQLQSHCRNQIMEQERVLNISYVHIINTREDIFFFKPLDLTFILQKYMGTKNNNHTAPPPGISSLGQPICDLLTKGCLGWGGMNMRVQILRREHIHFMDRLTLIQQLYVSNESYYNPEIFEMSMAQRLRMQVCEVNVEEYPVTAARISYLDSLPCFVHPELKRYEKESPPCVPQSTMQLAITRLCPRLRTRYEFIPWQTTPFIPNKAFPLPRNAITGQHGRMNGKE